MPALLGIALSFLLVVGQNECRLERITELATKAEDNPSYPLTWPFYNTRLEVYEACGTAKLNLTYWPEIDIYALKNVLFYLKTPNDKDPAAQGQGISIAANPQNIGSNYVFLDNLPCLQDGSYGAYALVTLPDGTTTISDQVSVSIKCTSPNLNPDVTVCRNRTAGEGCTQDLLDPKLTEPCHYYELSCTSKVRNQTCEILLPAKPFCTNTTCGTGCTCVHGICDQPGDSPSTCQCRCNSGYTSNAASSTKCDIPASPNLCNTDPDPCNGHGTCIALGDIAPACICDAGYEAPNCTRRIAPPYDPCDSNTCGPGGSCGSPDGQFLYFCECAHDRLGRSCSFESKVAACATAHCDNSGICQEPLSDGNAPYYCACPKFSAPMDPVDHSGGPNCAPESDCSDHSHAMCLHGGTCSGTLLDRTEACRCTSNWKGTHCEYPGRLRNITLRNSCKTPIWPAWTADSAPQGGGIKLQPGDSAAFQVDTNWISARFWARTGCQESVAGDFLGECSTGDCGKSLQCPAGSNGKIPATLAELTLGDQIGDFFDISLVDGYNVGVQIVPLRLSWQSRYDTSKNFYSSCRSTYCSSSHFLTNCEEIGGMSYGESGNPVGCLSECSVVSADPTATLEAKEEACCKGIHHDLPSTCPAYSSTLKFKALCPLAYSFAYDDGTSTFTCAAMEEPDYLIIFCPGGVS